MYCICGAVIWLRSDILFRFSEGEFSLICPIGANITARREILFVADKYHSAKPNIIGNAYSIVITPASISQTVSQSVSMS